MLKEICRILRTVFTNNKNIIIILILVICTVQDSKREAEIKENDENEGKDREGAISLKGGNT